MQTIFRRTALFLNLGTLLLAGCTENRPAAPQAPVTLSQPPSATVETSPTPEAPSPEAIADPPVTAPIPPPETPVDPTGIERRFLAAPSDPTARIAAIRELAHTTPTIALSLLNRLFPIERREDVKSEMLAALGDLDHSKERDNQLALCTKALAPNQPTRIRYIAIHTMVDLHDPRARAILLPLQNDPDHEIRAAAAQALSDLGQ